MTGDLTADEIVRLLDLRPHPAEGGFFAETYRADEFMAAGGLPGRYQDERSIATGIYFFLTPDTFSAMHRLKSDEIFHFYLGDPVEMLQLRPDGSGEVLMLGTELRVGMRPQIVVRHGVWQGLRLREGGTLALLGTTVAPGFDYADFELGLRSDLQQRYPRFTEQIESLTQP